MKIKIEEYNTEWSRVFDEIKSDTLKLIGFLNPQIEHIGSTSVDGLSAKPIIDILVGLENGNDLNKTIQPLMNNGYIYYERYNKEMPYRRFFVRHKDNYSIPANLKIITEQDEIPSNTEEHDSRLAHVHVLPLNSEHWTRHIAFRDYLKEYPKIRNEYQNLKEELKYKEWRDGNEYNKAKDKFIKEEERKAVKWYHEKYVV